MGGISADQPARQLVHHEQLLGVINPPTGVVRHGIRCIRGHRAVAGIQRQPNRPDQLSGRQIGDSECLAMFNGSGCGPAKGSFHGLRLLFETAEEPAA
ncbi:hypothetical protein [Ideonella sp.]|uniref:hypothetical protein n=1 Tax=Ideonella sp. TaxID=1929293 RepID=UPI003BB6C4FC